jgi:GNAT superfamily N-acetyltransferase
MAHPLDNPVWYALTGPHACLAHGVGLARHYPRTAAPFSAFAEPTEQSYADLARDLPPGLEARLFRAAEEIPPPGWTVVSARPIWQMVADAVPSTHPAESSLAVLGPDDAGDMLALAKVTKPGPYGPRTHELGRFLGWRDPDGQLCAMAGERFRFPGYVELSALCVDPRMRGRGLGAALAMRLARESLARGEQPFLHVFPDNPARRLYGRLGFRRRTMLWVLWHRP